MSPVQALGLATTLLMVVAYVGHSLRQRREPLLPTSIAIAIASAGIWGGLRVIYLAFNIQHENVHGEDHLFILIGGMAVVWVSTRELVQHFGLVAPSDTAPPRQEPRNAGQTLANQVDPPI